MSKIEKLILALSSFGLGYFTFICLKQGFSENFKEGLYYYFDYNYITSCGAVFVLSCLGFISLLVSHIIRKRKQKGKKPISNAYKISFYLSFVPYVLFLGYCAYCSLAGFEFFGTTYGWEGFCDAFIIMGFVFCIIPVLPFCLFWQILYIIKWAKNRKIS